MNPLLGALLALALTTPLRGGADEALTDFSRLYPAVILDIRYATPDNFTHTAVYPAPLCLLRRSVAERLKAAAKDFEKQGLRLIVYDCYRPLSVQKKFWALVPDERYVADPAKGSRHNRGAAVDVSLADAGGKPLSMPSAYDDFTEKAGRGYAGASPEALANRRRLEKVMLRRGFEGLPAEWWHFDARGWEKFPVLDIPLEKP